MVTNRRTFLGAAATVLVGAPVVTQQSADVYPSNSALYADPRLTEGVDYGRRHKRHQLFDNDLTQRSEPARTTIVAPHGGGIETGTSELCLAVAGYHPASLAPTPAAGPTYDYWMFEGLRASNNTELHVTSAHCDDTTARSLCAGALNALGLHGCTTTQAGLADGTQAALVGGISTSFKQRLMQHLDAAGIQAIDAAGHPNLNGDHPDNIANRTLLGMGGQLEITTPLRHAMFTINTRADRKNTTTATFWTFVDATRAAIASLESSQPVA